MPTGTPLKKSVRPSFSSGQGGTGRDIEPWSATYRSSTPGWSRGSVSHTSVGWRSRLCASTGFFLLISSTGTPWGQQELGVVRDAVDALGGGDPARRPALLELLVQGADTQVAQRAENRAL